ncbi:MAG: hypothetical protein ABI606_07440 [Rhodoferax sp.]
MKVYVEARQLRHLALKEGFLQRQGWTTALVRPDFQVFGGAASPEQQEALLLTLAEQVSEIRSINPCVTP